MFDAAKFDYARTTNPFGEITLKPRLPITLATRNNSIEEYGLLDTGAEINVLPHSLGLALGGIWRPDQATIRLSDNLSSTPAGPLAVQALVSDFPAAWLAFAWAQSDNVPLLLGQVNFFMEFDVCFYRSQAMFEVRPRSEPHQS
jgi:hypothetical protein